jgi:hypothetical protein
LFDELAIAGLAFDFVGAVGRAGAAPPLEVPRLRIRGAGGEGDIAIGLRVVTLISLSNADCPSPRLVRITCCCQAGMACVANSAMITSATSSSIKLKPERFI